MAVEQLEVSPEVSQLINNLEPVYTESEQERVGQTRLKAIVLLQRYGSPNFGLLNDLEIRKNGLDSYCDVLSSGSGFLRFISLIADLGNDSFKKRDQTSLQLEIGRDFITKSPARKIRVPFGDEILAISSFPAYFNERLEAMSLGIGPENAQNINYDSCYIRFDNTAWRRKFGSKGLIIPPLLDHPLESQPIPMSLRNLDVAESIVNQAENYFRTRPVFYHSEYFSPV